MALHKSMLNNGLDIAYLRKMAKQYVGELPRVHQVLAARYILDGGDERPDEISDMGFIEYLEYQMKETGDGAEASGDQADRETETGDSEASETGKSRDSEATTKEDH